MIANAPTFELHNVALTVNDPARVGAWYEEAVGLHQISRDGATVRYGAADGTVLLELRRDRDARRPSRREAGLFHTAFLLPERADLGRWLDDAIDKGTVLSGASDHRVSEAVYLNDPEGNGVEIYADRPRAAWTKDSGGIDMGTERLDVEDLLRSVPDGKWAGAPEGTRVGHLHLKVGAIPEAETFWTGDMGLSLTARYPGGSFFAADGYHHHIAANIWTSEGAGPRSYPSTGLDEVIFSMPPARAAQLRGGEEGSTPLTLTDPWGSRFTLKAA